MGQIKAYISHRISDGGGDADTSMEENCKRAVEFGKLMRKEFPTVEWYVPADHETFVHIAYIKELLTIPQILEVDCDIINSCNFMLVFSPDDYISKGMQVEVDHCNFTHTSIISAIDGNYEEYMARIIQAVNCYLVSLLR